VAVVLIGGTALLAARVFLYQPFDTPSGAMEPSLHMGDYFLVSLRAYAARAPARGDIVVFRRPDGQYVKRIAGIAGDRVQMRHGALVVNGNPVPRRRVDDVVLDGDTGPQRAPQYEELLPSGRRYRTLDFVPDGALDNTPEVLVPAGRYFVLGDDRDNSNDSRLDIGFVARADIVGKVAVRYFDGHRFRPAWEPVN